MVNSISNPGGRGEGQLKLKITEEDMKIRIYR